MLFRTLRRMIERGQTDGLEEKIEYLHDHSKLTDEEYETLIKMLRENESKAE